MTGNMQITKTSMRRYQPAPWLLGFAIFVLVAFFGLNDQDRSAGVGAPDDIMIVSIDFMPDSPESGTDPDSCGPGPSCLAALLVISDVTTDPTTSDTPAPAATASVHTQTGPPLDHPPITV